MSLPSLTFKAGGTLKESNFYIERAADQELTSALLRGEFCYVLAPRQMGKSSLRYRVARQLSKQHGVVCATIDLTGIGTSTTTTAEAWFTGIARELVRQTGSSVLAAAMKEYWTDQGKLPPVQRFVGFLREVWLTQTLGKVVVFVDEIDAIRTLPFSSDDFFAAIRSIYNARSDDLVYERLSFCLLGVAQPGDLIRNEQITPFNIGTRIDLADFERGQLASLASGLQQTGADPARLLDAIFDWTNGHPYMVQTLCDALAPAHISPPQVPLGQESKYVSSLVERLFLQRSLVRNPNLDYAEKCFARGDSDSRLAKMLALYARLSRGERIAADGRDPIQGALQLTGMAAPRRSNTERVLQIRNRIFATVFDAAWVRAKQSERFLSEPLHRWLESARNDDFVLRGDALREAELWVDQRVDTTSDEQEFLRACWRVQTAEERVRAEGAVQSARIAQAEAEAAQAKVNAERLERERAETQALAEKTERERAEAQAHAEKAERERAEAQTLAEKAERERAEAQTLAEKAERERAMATAQAQLRSRTNRLLSLIIVTLLVALAVAYGLYSQSKREEQAKAAALQAKAAALEEAKRAAERERTERTRADRLTRAARGETAKLLARSPGDVEALREGLQAIGPDLAKQISPPPEAVDGLTAAAQALGYPLLSLGFPDTEVTAASFSPDGSRVLTARKDGTANIWDAQTGSPLFTMKGHSSEVFATNFSSDGRRALTSGKDGTARIWDAQTGASLFTLKGHSNEVLAANFSSDGSRILTVSKDGTARIWDAQSGSSLVALSGHASGVHTAHFDPKGGRVLTASKDNTARIWDVRSGSSLFTLNGHSDEVLVASFSLDGNRVLTASKDGTARIWNAQTGSSLHILSGHSNEVLAASFSDDGDRVLTASRDGSSRIWDAKTGFLLFILKGHANDVFAASFSPDGSRVLTASKDGSACIWDAKTGTSLVCLRIDASSESSLLAASFSPNGRLALTVHDGTARIWDAKVSSSLCSLKGHTSEVLTATFSPDNKRVLTASKDGTARIWDARTGSPLFTLEGHSDEVFAGSFSPDGSRVLTSSNDRTARLWNAQTGSSLFSFSNSRGIAATLSSNGSRILTVDNGSTTVHLWNAQTGSSLFSYHLKDVALVMAASLSSDERRVVIAGLDGTVLLVDAQTGSRLHALKGHSAWVTNASFSSDGSRVITTSTDGTTRIWDASNGSSLFVLEDGFGSLGSASFSRDGSRILTDRGSAHIWDSKTGAKLATVVRHYFGAHNSSFSPDGGQVVGPRDDGTVYIWDAKSGDRLFAFSDHRGKVLSAAFSSNGEQVVTAGADGLAYIYSTKLDFYVLRACELLRGHRDEFHDVADVCKHVGVLPLPPLPTEAPTNQTEKGSKR